MLPFSVVSLWLLFLGCCEWPCWANNYIAPPSNGVSSVKHHRDQGTPRKRMHLRTTDLPESSYKYFTMEYHQDNNCRHEIRYNATFLLDTCVNATLLGDYQGANSYSFHYKFNNIERNVTGGTWFHHQVVYMVFYSDDSCMVKEEFGSTGDNPNIDQIGCDNGYSYTVSNDLSSSLPAVSYAK
jgi:hypothetical protein